MRRRWECSRCGRTLRARVEVRVLFHGCDPRRHRRIARIPDVEGITVEELRSALWRDAFERALGADDVMLRRL